MGMTLGGPKTLGSLCIVPTICFGIAGMYAFTRSEVVGGSETIGVATFFGVSAWRAFTGRSQFFSTPMSRKRRHNIIVIVVGLMGVAFGLDVCFEAWRLDKEFSHRVQLFLFAGAFLLIWSVDIIYRTAKQF
jgi:hypothetical protein